MYPATDSTRSSASTVSAPSSTCWAGGRALNLTPSRYTGPIVVTLTWVSLSIWAREPVTTPAMTSPVPVSGANRSQPGRSRAISVTPGAAGGAAVAGGAVGAAAAVAAAGPGAAGGA